MITRCATFNVHSVLTFPTVAQPLQPFLCDDTGAVVATEPLRKLKSAVAALEPLPSATPNHESEAFAQLWGGPAHQSFMTAWAAQQRK